MSGNDFPSEARLHRGWEFARVFRRQQKAANSSVVVLLAPRPKRWAQARARLGLMVSTKVNKRAVRRHRLKRLVREWFRCHGQHGLVGIDVVVLFRRDLDGEQEGRLPQQLDRLLAVALSKEPKPRRHGGRKRR